MWSGSTTGNIWNLNNLNVGIGTAVPQNKFHVKADTGANALVRFEAYQSTPTTSFTFYHARGTMASPQSMLKDDSIGGFEFRGCIDTSGTFSSGGRGNIVCKASEDWTTSANGTYFSFHTTSSGTTTNTERMRLTSEGMLGIGTTNEITNPLTVYGPRAGAIPNIPLKFVRNVTTTSGLNSSMIGVSNTNGDMTDGFGVGLLFAIEDNLGVENYIAKLGFSRDGEDNSGKYEFQTYNNGVNTTKMVIKKNGLVGIGTTEPSQLLVLSGGTIQIANGNQGTNKILTSNSTGTGNWSSVLEDIKFEFRDVDNTPQSYVLDLYAYYSYNVSGITVEGDQGTSTFNIVKSGTNIIGLTSLTATSTLQHFYSSTAKSTSNVSVGNEIVLDITGVSGTPRVIRGKLMIIRT